MNLPCEMIRDLLPLYHDGVCSQQSMEAVSAHLTTCASCRQFLQELGTEPEPEWELSAARPLASVSRKWEKGLRRALVKGILCAALIFCLLLGCFLALTQWKWLSIDTAQMEVAEIYQLSDGRILYKLNVPAGVWSNHFEFTHREDGSTYLTPKRSIIELSQQQGWDSLLDHYLMIDVAEHNAWAASNGGVAETRYYIGSPEDPHALLIWQEGMVLEPAPEALEAIYG